MYLVTGLLEGADPADARPAGSVGSSESVHYFSELYTRSESVLNRL